MAADQFAKKNYSLVTDIPNFIERINQRLRIYNEESKKNKLKLVMFLDACGHVSRICRILRQPKGNALLLGVGGSGRQSLARLATYINGYDCYQIDVIDAALFGLPVVATEQKDADNIKSDHRQTYSEIGIN